MNTTINTYQFQTIGGRKFNVSANSIEEAQSLAIEWRNKFAPKSSVAYNYRVN